MTIIIIIFDRLRKKISRPRKWLRSCLAVEHSMPLSWIGNCIKKLRYCTHEVFHVIFTPKKHFFGLRNFRKFRFLTCQLPKWKLKILKKADSIKFYCWIIEYFNPKYLIFGRSSFSENSLIQYIPKIFDHASTLWLQIFINVRNLIKRSRSVR